MRISLAIEKVLEILRGKEERTAALVNALAAARGGERSGTGAVRGRRESQKYYALLYHLKREGLIEKKARNGRSYWRIRPAGAEKLAAIKRMKLYSAASARYAEAPDTLKIIAFDIPSNEDRKRYWLRAALKNLGFSMLQKSVWVGKKKIPERFLRDLRERRMLGYVHILAVTKTGSLREMQ